MDTQKGVADMGATMRLGAYPCEIRDGTYAHDIYGATRITERHRHRWEVNNKYRPAMEEKGLLMSGVSPNNHLVEIVELSNHPWFVGVQFHPEFCSKPLVPHPLFVSYIGAAMSNRGRRLQIDASGSQLGSTTEEGVATRALSAKIQQSNQPTDVGVSKVGATSSSNLRAGFVVSNSSLETQRD